MPIQIQGKVREAFSGHGLGNVSVSNGEAIVQTDSLGRYTLQVEPEQHRFVFVTAPDGFKPSDTFFRPTKTWTDSIDDVDFELEPQSDRESFSIVHISDTHVVTGEDRLTEGSLLARDLQNLVDSVAPSVATELDLIIASGDLTNRGEYEELKSYREAIQTVKIPVFSLFGGHDGNEERRTGEAGTTFTRHYEDVLGPTYYSFDWGTRHFILYPAEDHFFSEEDRQRKERWVWQDITQQPKNREIIVVLHTPPSIDFLEQLSRYNVSLLLYGHWHSSKVFTYKNIIVAATQSLCFGGIDTTPRGYRQVTFSPDGIKMELKALSESNFSPSTFDSPSEIRLDDRDEEILHLLWQEQLDIGLHRAAPVCDGDNLILSLWDEEHRGRQGICCLDARTGQTRWRVVTDASIKNSVATTDRYCAAVSITGRVYVIETTSGRVLWHADLPGYPERWVYTSPAIGEGTVYAGAKSGYAAYDLETGEQRWYAKIEGSDAWSCYASPQIYEDLVLLLVSRRGLLALNRETGEIVWEQKMATEYQYPSPTVTENLLVSGGDSGSIAVLDARSGQIIWHKKILSTAYATGLTVNADKIYATTVDGEAQCYALHSGELHWQFRLGNDLLDMTPYRRGVHSALARPVLFENKLIVCGIDGYLYILDESGKSVSQTFFGSPISATPCTVEKRLYVGMYDGRICCFEDF